MCHISLLSQVPSLSEPFPFLGRSEQRAPSLSWASSWAAITSLSEVEKVKPTSWTMVSLCGLHSRTLLRPVQTRYWMVPLFSASMCAGGQ